MGRDLCARKTGPFCFSIKGELSDSNFVLLQVSLFENQIILSLLTAFSTIKIEFT